MKPIPEALLALYPSRGDTTIPDRPWWRLGSTGGLVRHDGAWTGGPPKNLTPEEIDREYPLPHPGFRVGQVWGQVDNLGNVHVTHIEHEELGDLYWPDGTQESRERALETMVGWFLLADPCASWLAPWSPKESP